VVENINGHICGRGLQLQIQQPNKCITITRDATRQIRLHSTETPNLVFDIRHPSHPMDSFKHERGGWVEPRGNKIRVGLYRKRPNGRFYVRKLSYHL